MSKCRTCRADVPPGQLITHVVKRSDGTVARELVVCARCKRVLDEGAADKSKPTTGDQHNASTDDHAEG